MQDQKIGVSAIFLKALALITNYATPTCVCVSYSFRITAWNRELVNNVLSNSLLFQDITDDCERKHRANTTMPMPVNEHISFAQLLHRPSGRKINAR